jgi:glucokinase
MDGTQLGPRSEAPSFAKEGHQRTLDAIADAVEQCTRNQQPRTIGIAIPGHVDAFRGIVRWAPNFGEYRNGEFHMWCDVDVAGPMSHRTGSVVVVGNDANLAALGEYMYGSGEASAQTLVLFTVGTGIGSGVVIGPKAAAGLNKPTLLVGANGGAVELGHTAIMGGGRKCSCGSHGCVEAYCGTSGLLETARELGVEAKTPRELHELALGGEQKATLAWREFGTHLGLAVSNAIDTFAPDVVAVGGQVSKAWDLFESSLNETAAAESIPSLFEGVRITKARQLEDAGLLGAAAIAIEAAT